MAPTGKLSASASASDGVAVVCQAEGRERSRSAQAYQAFPGLQSHPVTDPLFLRRVRQNWSRVFLQEAVVPH